jgi:hypothetical protein
MSAPARPRLKVLQVTVYRWQVAASSFVQHGKLPRPEWREVATAIASIKTQRITIRLIDENGEMVGVVPLSAALSAPRRRLGSVEVQRRPASIQNSHYSKFKYRQKESITARRKQ